MSEAFRRRLVWPGLLLLAVLPYLTAARHPFVYDDYAQVVRNDLVRSLDPRPVLAVGSVTHGRVEWYRPLAVYSLALNYAASGLDPWSYRLVNVALHAANTALVFTIAGRIGRSSVVASAAAALFAVHAVHSEAVVPAFGRADLLAAFFALLAWRLSLSSRSGRCAVAATAAAVLAALLSKENAVALIPVIVATDLAVRNRGAGTLAARLSHLACARWRLYAALAIVLLVYAGLRFWATGALLAADGVRYIENPLVQAGPVTRAATALWVVIRYVGLFLVPFPLTVDYSYNQIPVVARWTDPRLLGLALLVPAAITLPRFWRACPRAALALLFFVLLLAPVSNLILPIGTIMAERLLYLPSVGLCLLAGHGLAAVYGQITGRAGRAVLAGFAILIAAHAAVTLTRNRDWASERKLFAAAAAASPHSAKAHFNHASALVDAGKINQAEEALRRTLAIASAYPEAHNLLGTLRLARGEVAEAGRAFEAALRDAPDYPPALGNLGIVRRREGRMQDAQRLLERAVRLDPSMAIAYVNLGLIAEIQGDLRQAVAHYRRAYALDPTLEVARSRAEDLGLDWRK